MKRLQSKFIPLTSLGLIFAWAVFRWGAVLPETWNCCACALALLAILYPLLTPKDESPPPLSSALKWATFLLPGYVAFQLMPIPLSFLGILSPAKARLIYALGPVIPGIRAEPIAVNPTITFQHLIRITSYVLVFLLARQLVFRFPGRAWICTVPLVAVATVEALVGMVQYANLDASAGLIRGTYVDRNHFACMLELAFPFAVVGAILLVRQSGTEEYLRFISAGCIAALILFGIVCSFSRMGVLSALCSLAIIGVFEIRSTRPRRARWFAITCMVLVLFEGAALFVPTRLAERFDEFSTPGTAAIDRRAIWTQTLRVAADYPWFGCGLGGYQFTYLKYKTEMPQWTTPFAHNDYLQGLAELGIVGSVLAILLLLPILHATVCGLQSAETEHIRALALACAASIAAILMHSFVDFNLYIPANAMEVAWVCGIAVALPLRLSG